MNLLSFLIPTAHAADLLNTFQQNLASPVLSNDLLGSVQIGINGGLLAVGGIIFLMFVYLGMKMILAAGDEPQQKEVKDSFSHIVFGTVLIGGAQIIARAFSPRATGQGVLGVVSVDDPVSGTITNQNAVLDLSATTILLNTVVQFIFGTVTIALISAIVYQAVRMIIAQEEGEVATARKRLLEGLFGAAVVILSHRFVDAFAETSSQTILRIPRGHRHHVRRYYDDRLC